MVASSWYAQRPNFRVPLSTQCIEWSFLRKLVKKRKQGAWQCSSECDEPPEKIEGFSEQTRRVASLLPIESSAPTAVLGGFNMHRMKSVTPAEDTARKLGALGTARGGIRGRVLDVCTGLGYTCLGAARTPNVDEVVTIERTWRAAPSTLPSTPHRALPFPAVPACGPCVA